MSLLIPFHEDFGINYRTVYMSLLIPFHEDFGINYRIFIIFIINFVVLKRTVFGSS